MSRIVALKMVSGEEIIANLNGLITPEEIFDNSNSKITISKVRVLHLTGAGDRIGLALAPFMFSNIDGSVDIKTANIMAVSNDIPKQIEQTYVEQTTGLALASNM